MLYNLRSDQFLAVDAINMSWTTVAGRAQLRVFPRLFANGLVRRLNLFPVLAEPMYVVHLSLVFWAIRVSRQAAKSLGSSS
jgi:hypothetical protein